jgi:hypothetical protein
MFSLFFAITSFSALSACTNMPAKEQIAGAPQEERELTTGSMIPRKKNSGDASKMTREQAEEMQRNANAAIGNVSNQR